MNKIKSHILTILFILGFVGICYLGVMYPKAFIWIISVVIGIAIYWAIYKCFRDW